ncbi:MAG: PEGA domain-containing protein [Myxococcales bacterium]|nr:PEGA domain-containing protein [Myxococcales bacterium]
METSSRTSFRLGPYTCVERLGTGPLGETFRAKLYGLAGLERLYAVKRLHPKVAADERLPARLAALVKVQSKLTHEGLARYHDLETDGTSRFLVGDYVHGMDLRTLQGELQRRNERLSPDLAAVIIAEAARAIAHAHGRNDLLTDGIIHAGLTPETVMVTAQGGVKVLDVGLLRSLQQGEWVSDPAVAKCVPYFAPEVLQGEPPQASSDAWSLGALLWELATLGPPFTARDVEALLRSVEAGPVGVPRDPTLGKLARQCLEVTPTARLDCATLAVELTTHLGTRLDDARARLASLLRRLVTRQRVTGMFEVPVAVLSGPSPASLSPADAPRAPAGFWLPPTLTADGVVRRTTAPMPAFRPSEPRAAVAEVVPAPAAPAAQSASEFTAAAQEDASFSSVDVEGWDPPEPGAEPAVIPAKPAQPAPEPPAPTPAAAPVAPPLRAGGNGTQPMALFAVLSPAVIAAAALPSGAPTMPQWNEPTGQIPRKQLPREAPEPNSTARVPPLEGKEAQVVERPSLHELATSLARRQAEVHRDEVQKRSLSALATSLDSRGMHMRRLLSSLLLVAALGVVATAAALVYGGEVTAIIFPSAPLETPLPSPSKLPVLPRASLARAFEVNTTPRGATVFVDGEPQGKTPASLIVTPGRHQLVIVAEGRRVTRREVEVTPSGGELAVVLKRVSPFTAPGRRAGVWVKCKTVGELRILVDGVDTGLTCPNRRRIGVTPGSHRIGLYSPRTGRTVFKEVKAIVPVTAVVLGL